MKTRRSFAALAVALVCALVATMGVAIAARGDAPGAPANPGRPDDTPGVRKNATVDQPANLTPPFTDVNVFATKTGFRGVVSWSASAAVSPIIKWGLTPGNLNQSLIVPDAPDRAGVAVIDDLEIGTTYYVTITDAISSATVGPLSFVAANAYNNYDAAAGAYTLNMLVQLDSQSLPVDVPSDQGLADIAAGVNVFAERLYDALDKQARLGQVLVTDTQIAYAVNEPFGVEETIVATSNLNPCGADRNLADVLVQTTIPFDSHTFGWAIDEPCTSFYVGRLGQLVTPWEDDLHFGYVSTHEMLHYAFGAPDLYDPAETGSSGCRNLDWDGSLMHNTGGWAGNQWALTELDRNATQTPCDTQYDSSFTWDYLQARYTKIPDGPIDHMFDTLPRGNADGGSLEISILDRTPAGSTLTPFTPDDSNPEINAADTCAADFRSTTFVDPRSDATRMIVDTGRPEMSDPALDLVGGGAAYVDVDGDGTPSAADTLTFTVQADDLKATPALASQGEYMDFAFSIGSRKFYALAEWDHVRPPVFELGEFTTTRSLLANVTGTWDIVTNEIKIVVPAVIPAPDPEGLFSEDAPAALQELFPADEPDPNAAPAFAAEPGAKITGLAITSRRLLGVIVPDADVASGGCSLQLPGTPPPPPPPPTPREFPTEPDVVLNGVDTAAIKGIVPVTNAGYGECVDNLQDPRCVVYMVEVNSSSGDAVLEFDISADSDLLHDFDIYIYDMDGTNIFPEGLGAGALGPYDGAALPVASGRYYVQVVPYDAVAGAEYTLGLTSVGTAE